mgnify:CR=1 FL=1
MRVDKSVIVLFRQMNLFLNRELLDEKLTSSDVLYLALLYEQDGRTQDEMAEAYTVDRAATTRSLQGLEKKGLVRREVDTFDRRIRRVYLTEKAMQYRTAIRRMADDLADALFEGMSEEEVKAFMAHGSVRQLELQHSAGNIVRQEYLKKLPHVVGRSGCNAFRQNFPFFRFEDDVQGKPSGTVFSLFPDVQHQPAAGHIFRLGHHPFIRQFHVAVRDIDGGDGTAFRRESQRVPFFVVAGFPYHRKKGS